MDTGWRRFQSWLRRKLLHPFSSGISGFILSIAFWFGGSIAVLFVLGADEELTAIAQANGSAEGLETLARSTGLYRLSEILANATGLSILQTALTFLAAVVAVVATVWMGFVGWIWLTTVAAVFVIWRALNGHPLSKRDDRRTAFNGIVLLALVVTLYSVKAWLFVVWEALLFCGVIAAAWRLRYPAKREFFGVDARRELEAAQEAGKVLGFVLLLVLGAILAYHDAIARLPDQWLLALLLAAAGLILWFVLLVEGHVRKAVSIALHERSVYRIRNRDT